MTTVDQDEVVHVVGWCEWLLADVLQLWIPRALCGVSLLEGEDDRDPYLMGWPYCERCVDKARPLILRIPALARRWDRLRRRLHEFETPDPGPDGPREAVDAYDRAYAELHRIWVKEQEAVDQEADQLGLRWLCRSWFYWQKVNTAVPSPESNAANDAVDEARERISQWQALKIFERYPPIEPRRRRLRTDQKRLHR